MNKITWFSFMGLSLWVQGGGGQWKTTLCLPLSGHGQLVRRYFDKTRSTCWKQHRAFGLKPVCLQSAQLTSLLGNSHRDKFGHDCVWWIQEGVACQGTEGSGGCLAGGWQISRSPICHPLTLTPTTSPPPPPPVMQPHFLTAQNILLLRTRAVFDLVQLLAKSDVFFCGFL